MSDPSSLQMIASKSLGGAERWFVRFSAALAERSVPVELAIRRASGLDEIELPAVPVHRLPYRTTWDPISRRAAARLVRKARPDIVQTYMGRATRLIRLDQTRRPVHLVRLGGYYRLGPFRHAHAWIGNTKALCDWMIANGLPADRVHHIYNFAEPPEPRPAGTLREWRHRHGLPADAWVLTTLGRLVHFKGHRHLIDALARLPRFIGERPLRVVLAGDGPLAPALRAQAAQCDQDDRIIWAGWQRDPSLCLQLADLVVFPSLDAEPFGNVILEAWSWAKPLLCSRFRGAREVVRHGEDAWTVPCADPQALADAIIELLSQPQLMTALAEAGSRRARSDFGRDVIVERYLELYRTLAGR